MSTARTPPEPPQFALPFERRVFSVRELNGAVRALLENRYGSVWVEGEISNFKQYPSGHWYFTLKDEAAQLKAAIFRRDNARLRFRPEDGMKVLCHGRISVYEQRGEYQLIADDLEPRGSGALQLAFEALKAKLQAEGLFDAGRKRPLPRRPVRVGLVTSSAGAALRDLLQVMARRDPGMPVLLCPTKVQGEGAAAEIASALRRLGQSGRVDVIICGRGGGSLEDLWAFNEEVVARAIAACPVPVVSAVGHEVDFTIADFVADVRAPTPSAAAELVVPERAQLHRDLAALRERGRRAVLRGVADARHQLVAARARVGDPRHLLAEERLALDELAHRAISATRDRHAREHRTLSQLGHRLRQRHPAAQVHRDRARLRQQHERLGAAGRRRLDEAGRTLDTLAQQLGGLARRNAGDAGRAFAVLAGKLDALSPLAILKRGYAIARHDDGRVVARADQAAPGDHLRLLLSAGSLSVRVEARSLPDAETEGTPPPTDDAAGPPRGTKPGRRPRRR